MTNTPDEVILDDNGQPLPPARLEARLQIRRKLADAAARFDPEARAAFRSQLGMPPRARQA